MPLIAMTREMGSLGVEVARRVGEALGVPVIHNEFIDALADKMRVRKSHVIRLLEGKQGLFENMSADRTSMAIYTAEETFRLAASGNGAVIRGWGSPFLLRSVPHSVCVRVCAPMDLRIQRIMERADTDDFPSVKEEVLLSDEAHSAIVRRNFHNDWRDAELYDVVLNTERVPIDQCVDEILDLAHDPSFAETDDSRSVLQNLALEAAVRAGLRRNPGTRDVRIAITVSGSQVALSGTVDTADCAVHCERIASETAGVNRVINQLRPLDATRH